jgi:RNA polymerase sigma-70 factor (ECF subfamily)
MTDSTQKNPDETSDQTRKLVEQAQNGDVDALNALFERYYEIMLDMARRRLGARLRSKEDPADLAQTTFREAHRDFGSYQYRGAGSLLSWLIQILSNKIRDRAEFYSAGKRDLSKERSMEAPAGDGGESRFFEPSADDLTVTMQVQQVEDFDQLRKALDELSDDHRQAITLVFFQGMTLRQAGQEMDGRSEDAVRMLLRRAEARLRDLLKAAPGSGELPTEPD